MPAMMNKRYAGLTALVLVCIVSPAGAGDSSLIGGPGGGNFRDQCGAGQYLSGVSVRQGTLLDAVVPFCAAFNAKTGLLGAPGFPMNHHGGSGGGLAGPISCNNDQYVSGMMFGYTNDSQSGRPKYIASIQLQCKPIRPGSKSQTRTIGAGGRLSHQGYSCRDDEAVIGMIGRSGAYVDALGMICGPRPVATGPAVSPPPPGPGPKPDAILNQKNQRASVSVETGVDRPGQDYRSFDLAPSIAGFDPCKSACESDANCKAWTFVKPGVQGPKARCWLKSGTPPPRPNGCCVSGVKAGN